MKYHGETPLNIEYTLKSERQECKIGPVGGRRDIGGGRVNMVETIYILLLI
jgi:hypothetical protein